MSWIFNRHDPQNLPFPAGVNWFQPSWHEVGKARVKDFFIGQYLRKRCTLDGVSMKKSDQKSVLIVMPAKRFVPRDEVCYTSGLFIW